MYYKRKANRSAVRSQESPSPASPGRPSSLQTVCRAWCRVSCLQSKRGARYRARLDSLGADVMVSVLWNAAGVNAW